MTIDEAIQHCEEVAIREKSAADGCRYWTDGMGEETAKKCEKCAKEHLQLAEWLKELKAYREQGGDVISRKHLLEEIAMLKKSPWFNENTYGSKVIRKEAVEIVEDVCIKREPSVTPQQKMGRWIPVSERLPEDIRPVIVTWKNTDPKSYYQYIVGKHFIGTAHYKNGKWFWYSSVTEDLLAEYGRCDCEEFDEAIDVIAWMPLPTPYKAESEE